MYLNQAGREWSLANAVTSPAASRAKSALSIMLNVLVPVPGPSVTSALLSSEILTNEACKYFTGSSLKAESMIAHTPVDVRLN